jgi:hypothetical protein
MSRKLLATLLLVAAATLAAPAAANAVDYTSGGDCTVSPSTLQGGETATLNCVAGTFGPSEDVSYVVSGQDGSDAHLASFTTSISTAHVVKLSNANGSAVLLITVPRTASGAYQITGTGASSHAVSTATVTVVPADDPSSSGSSSSSSSGSGLADTGSVVSASLIAAGVGLALAGIVLLLIITGRRRRESL